MARLVVRKQTVKTRQDGWLEHIENAVQASSVLDQWYIKMLEWWLGIRIAPQGRPYALNRLHQGWFELLRKLAENINASTPKTNPDRRNDIHLCPLLDRSLIFVPQAKHNLWICTSQQTIGCQPKIRHPYCINRFGKMPRKAIRAWLLLPQHNS